MLLHAQRQVGFEQPQKLRVTDVLAYAGISGHEPGDFLYIMAAMDVVYMEWFRAQRTNS